jgi:membrane-bound acyltransferase YfiQ involved in biofilm formation
MGAYLTIPTQFSFLLLLYALLFFPNKKRSVFLLTMKFLGLFFVLLLRCEEEKTVVVAIAELIWR